MDATTLTAHLAHEYALLAEALAEADPAAAVPSCPDWTATDLDNHLATVYAHKVEVMRRGEWPKPWPPAGGVGALADGYTALVSAFAVREPSDTSVTWFEPDQTVGFWIRRMAQETAIHRVDAQLAAGLPVTPFAPDLAADGIDEVLGWVVHGSVAWHEEFAAALADADPRALRLTTEGHMWTVTANPDGVRVEHGWSEADPATTISGTPDELYRWLWGRTDDVVVDGDEALVPQFKALLAPVQQ
jgi:uncharacterized protein (TIGR03083 family)